jgi:hypothetical protein
MSRWCISAPQHSMGLTYQQLSVENLIKFMMGVRPLDATPSTENRILVTESDSESEMRSWRTICGAYRAKTEKSPCCVCPALTYLDDFRSLSSLKRKNRFDSEIETRHLFHISICPRRRRNQSSTCRAIGYLSHHWLLPLIFPHQAPGMKYPVRLSCRQYVLKLRQFWDGTQ